LREPLRLEHVKPRLLGHWGTSPGLNFIYAHLNRMIRLQNADVIETIDTHRRAVRDATLDAAARWWPSTGCCRSRWQRLPRRPE
jgi:hypothetical protein